MPLSLCRLLRRSQSPLGTLKMTAATLPLALALVACGPIKKPAPEAAAPQSGAALNAPNANGTPIAPASATEADTPEAKLKKLDFYVLPAAEGDPARPRALAESERPVRRALQDPAVGLFLPDPIVLVSGEQFLIFREGTGEARWTSVFYQEAKHGYERHSMHFDPERRVWFLPLSQLFQAGNAPVEPGQLRELKLDLQAASGRRLEVSLLLKVIRPLPDGLGATEIRTVSLPSIAEDLGQLVRRGGIQVGSGTLANPFSRPVVFYLRAREAQPFQSEVMIWRRIHNPSVVISRVPWESDYADMNLDYVTAYRGGGLLGIRKLALFRPDGALIREMPLLPDQWAALPLQPGEQIRVSWVATASPGEAVCGMPQPGPAPEGQVPQGSTYYSWHEAWKLGWARFRGAMQWEARMAGAEIPVREVTREEPGRQVRPWISISRFAPLPIDGVAGDARYNGWRLRLACQGVL